MDWEDARLFLAVAREGKLLMAARKLGLNQATLSRRITQLEHSLEASLMVRGPQGAKLTPEGQALMERLERAEAAMLEGQGLFTGDSGTISGTVRVGAPDGFGVHFLSPRLGKLSTLHPHLRVELVPVPQSFSLFQREADVAIFVGRPKSGRAVIKKLADYSLSLYAAQSYVEEKGLPTDFEGHRLVGHVEDLLYASTLDYVSEFYGERPVDIAISGALGQIEAVRGGAGLGVLHDYMVAHDTQLVRLMPEKSARRSYWLAYHESHRETRRIKAIVDFVSAEVARAKPWTYS